MESLRNPPSFEALSHVWGDAPKRASIFIDGKIFEATKNLEGALQDLRRSGKPRIL